MNTVLSVQDRLTEIEWALEELDEQTATVIEQFKALRAKLEVSRRSVESDSKRNDEICGLIRWLELNTRSVQDTREEITSVCKKLVKVRNEVEKRKNETGGTRSNAIHKLNEKVVCSAESEERMALALYFQIQELNDVSDELEIKYE